MRSLCCWSSLVLFLAVLSLAAVPWEGTEPEACCVQQAAPTWFRDASQEYGPIGAGPPAFADLDGDGFPDLICDGKIYKNDRGKRFIDVTKDSGVAGSGTACVADVDN